MPRRDFRNVQRTDHRRYTNSQTTNPAGKNKKFKTKVKKILKDREGIAYFFAKEQDKERKVPQTEIVRIKSYDLTPMNVTEAIDQMEMVDHDFFIFLDEASLKVNVLYIREDGNYALIETN